jgi:hypothetical protein
MDVETFEGILGQFESEEHILLLGKRKEYALSADCLSNFKATATATCMSPEDVCVVLLMKHVQAIAKAAHDPSTRLGFGGSGAREGFSQRVADARNYLILLAALIGERPERA